MSIRKRDVHFSDWTKVRHALVCNNVQGITETSSFDEVRAFLINSESGLNPFYYYVCYIKETKEIYTHGQFYDCSKYDDSDILQKIEELESTLDTKVDLTVFEELQSEVKENELVTARALTELNEKKADLIDFNAIKAEIEENEEVTAAALADIYDKLDNLAIPDMSNYVEATTYQTDIATLSSSDETLQKNIDDVMASSLLKAEQSLTDEEKAQVKDNLGFSSNLVFNNVSADTWVEDTTYTDYGYRCDLVCTGVTASDYPEVIFDIDQANSGNYAPVCESDIDIVKIWSKVDDAIIVPTIQIIR